MQYLIFQFLIFQCNIVLIFQCNIVVIVKIKNQYVITAPRGGKSSETPVQIPTPNLGDPSLLN